jgi:hypothetical protein
MFFRFPLCNVERVLIHRVCFAINSPHARHHREHGDPRSSSDLHEVICPTGKPLGAGIMALAKRF